MRLKDLLEKILHKHFIRIKVDGAFICDTFTDGEIAKLYQDYFVDLIEVCHEIRDGDVFLFLEVWLREDENGTKEE